MIFASMFAAVGLANLDSDVTITVRTYSAAGCESNTLVSTQTLAPDDITFAIADGGCQDNGWTKARGIYEATGMAEWGECFDVSLLSASWQRVDCSQPPNIQDPAKSVPCNVCTANPDRSSFVTDSQCNAIKTQFLCQNYGNGQSDPANPDCYWRGDALDNDVYYGPNCPGADPNCDPCTVITSEGSSGGNTAFCAKIKDQRACEASPNSNSCEWSGYTAGANCAIEDAIKAFATLYIILIVAGVAISICLLICILVCCCGVTVCCFKAASSKNGNTSSV